jgi:hypothetical protein
MTIDERLDRLTGIAESLPSTVVAHDNQIEALLRIAEQDEQMWRELQRRWQAYIKTLPRR